MKQYLDLLARVLDEGTLQPNRTGIAAKRIAGGMLEFDMDKGFPAVTTKKLAFGAVVGELLGFIRGYSNAAQFRELGCKVWDQNANENEAWLSNPNRHGQDDLGRVYGVQWREWIAPYGLMPPVDQLKKALDDIIYNPTSRRIIVTAWNPGELGFMALPPCHMTYQFLVDEHRNEVSLCMYQRSCDMFLGIPFNIASYALLLHLVAKVTGRVPKKLIMFLADVHIYENHIAQVEEQLSREPMELCKISVNTERLLNYCTPLSVLENLLPCDIKLEGYISHPAIKGEMAV